MSNNDTARTEQIFNDVKQTYATRANAVRAVEKKYELRPRRPQEDKLHYVIAQLENGRFIPVFLGSHAVRAGTHFHFATAAG